MDKDKFNAMPVLNVNTAYSEATAELINNSEATLSRKINEVDGSEFVRSDIEKIATAWNLTETQVLEIFFPAYVESRATL